MAQWVDCLRNNIFINQLPLSLLCEISGALHLVSRGQWKNQSGHARLPYTYRNRVLRQDARQAG